MASLPFFGPQLGGDEFMADGDQTAGTSHDLAVHRRENEDDRKAEAALAPQSSSHYAADNIMSSSRDSEAFPMRSPGLQLANTPFQPVQEDQSLVLWPSGLPLGMLPFQYLAKLNEFLNGTESVNPGHQAARQDSVLLATSVDGSHPGALQETEIANHLEKLDCTPKEGSALSELDHFPYIFRRKARKIIHVWRAIVKRKRGTGSRRMKTVATMEVNRVRRSIHALEKHIFPFFELPQEIRDMIYDCCTADVRSIPAPWDSNPEKMHIEERAIHFKVKNTGITALLQLDKQIQKEYTKRIQKQATLLFLDHWNFEFQPLHITDERIKKAERAKFIMDVICDMQISGHARCQACRDLRSSIEWIQESLKLLPAIKEISVCLGIWWPEKPQVHYEWPATPHDEDLQDAIQEITQLDRIKELEIYRKPEWTPAAMEGKELEKKIWVGWNQKQGWVVKKEVPEKQLSEHESWKLTKRHCALRLD